MALKDLATDLSKFKYGLSSPDKVDNQIENGVDFFDDNEGGATGFTPKVGDLESQYKKFIEGNVVPPNDGLRKNTIDGRFAFGQNGEYGEVGNPGEANTVWMRRYFGDDYEGPGVLSGFQPNYYANLLPVEASTMWMNSSGNYHFTTEGTNPPNNNLMQDDFKNYPSFDINSQITLTDINGFSITNQPGGVDYGNPLIEGANGSDFMTTPLSGYISRLPNDVFNNPPNFSLYSQTFAVGGISIFGQYGNSFVIPNIEGANGSDFMTTPILGQTTSFPDPSDSLTLRIPFPNSPFSGFFEYEFNDDLRIPNANNSVDSLSKLTLSNNFGIPGDRQPSISSEGHELDNIVFGANTTTVSLGYNLDLYSTLNYPYPLSDGANLRDYGTDFETKWPDAAPSNIKQRGVYDEYILGDNLVFDNKSMFDIFNDEDALTESGRHFKETGRSIHISDDGQIQAGSSIAGLEYGALKYINDGKTVQKFELFSQNTPLTDKKAPTDNYPTTNLDRIPQPEFAGTDGLTSFDGKIVIINSEAISTSDTLTIPFNNYSGAPNSYFETTIQNVEQYKFSDWKNAWKSSHIDNELGGYVALENLVLLAADNNIDNITNTESTDIEFNGGTIFRINGKYSIDNQITRYGKYGKDGFTIKGKDFREVPAGLGENSTPTFKNFRDVADPTGIRHPLILREMGNRWGLDPIDSDTGPLGELAAGADGLLGGFVRGAPTFTGLVERNFADKLRIGKFLLTPRGIGFMTKQVVLQALNPTIESKLWNPLSILGISDGNVSDPESVVGAEGIRGLASLLAGLALPITHVERHIGGGRYEDLVPLTEMPDFILNRLPDEQKSVIQNLELGKANTGFGSRLAMQSNPEVIKQQTIDLGFLGSIKIGGKDLKTSLLFMNPNKYLFPISSAPKSVTKSGISFAGGLDLADGDANRIQSIGGFRSPDGKTRGGTFNKQTNAIETEQLGLLKRHSTLAYDKLHKDFRYDETTLLTPRERNLGKDELTVLDYDKRFAGREINDKIGSYQDRHSIVKHSDLGAIKGNQQTSNVDKLNIAPILKPDGNASLLSRSPLPKYITDNPDFVRFMFKDVVNNKYLIFRAILESITDNITPEFGETKFLGRPDKIYNYSGTNREISFNFKVYPKTKQELPVLMEKLNYLVSLCYPSYTEQSLMITPFIELTIGNMFYEASGLIGGLSINVEEASTWETDEGLQFPHFISCQCEFKYIGGDRNIPVIGGKHYDINWIEDDGNQGMKPTGMYMDETDTSKEPIREKFNYINILNNSSDIPSGEEIEAPMGFDAGTA